MGHLADKLCYQYFVDGADEISMSFDPRNYISGDWFLQGARLSLSTVSISTVDFIVLLSSVEGSRYNSIALSDTVTLGVDRGYYWPTLWFLPFQSGDTFEIRYSQGSGINGWGLCFIYWGI